MGGLPYLNLPPVERLEGGGEGGLGPDPESDPRLTLARGPLISSFEVQLRSRHNIQAMVSREREREIDLLESKRNRNQ